MGERADRIVQKARNNPKWKNAPVRIEKWECIVCDACLRECPPWFGAIFNNGIDVKVVPELCSVLSLPGIEHLAWEHSVGASIRLPPEEFASSTVASVLVRGATQDEVRAVLERAGELAVIEV